MKLYIVFKEGVYRHECLGAFDTLEKAVEAADHAAGVLSKDAYHDFKVFPFDLNRITPGKRTAHGPDFDEPDAIYYVRQIKGFDRPDSRMIEFEGLHYWSNADNELFKHPLTNVVLQRKQVSS